MSLNIKSQKAYDLATELARLTGESMTKAVTRQSASGWSGSSAAATSKLSSPKRWQSHAAAPQIRGRIIVLWKSSCTTNEACHADRDRFGGTRPVLFGEADARDFVDDG